MGVSAYLGAAASIKDKTVLTAAGSILPVEARHNTFLIGTNEGNPIPAAFDTPLGFNEVFTLASAFIVSCPADNPALPFKAFPPLEVGDPVMGSGETVYIKNAADGTFAVVIAGLQTFPVKVAGGQFVFPNDPSIQGEVLFYLRLGVNGRFIWCCRRMGVLPTIRLFRGRLSFLRIRFLGRIVCVNL